ncbi:MAG TPA: ATP-binding protein [Nakamurella sp.]|nr:ATP-binding protein [Nakamurella sp.]
MSIDQLRSIALFDGLTDDQLRELIAVGEAISFDNGDELFTEAQPADFWWLLLAGSVDLLRHVGQEDTKLGVMSTPGQWAGGFRAWDEHGVYMATGRGSSPGLALRVPAARLAERANAWFPFGAHLLRGLIHTARNIETMARQREALVALGTLAAGFAHEINNPASAATRAADALAASCGDLQSSLGRLAERSITAEQFIALDALRREIDPRAANSDPLAIADREDALSDWLTERGVDRDWVIAPSLAAAGLDVAWCEKAADVLGADGGDAIGPGLEWIASYLSTSALLAEVKESTRRISELVAAVKSYSQMDRASMQYTDVTEGIESTLVMLGHKVPTGVTVVRDYRAQLPRIEANAGELNQVWTNLIDNAIDAMNGVGRLRVSTRVADDGVVVEIGDSGTGMTPQVQAHAFEPFFTTKGVGRGTGLGLDIARRIVAERHGGEITIDQQPGETVFRVRLPLRAPAKR